MHVNGTHGLLRQRLERQEQKHRSSPGSPGSCELPVLPCRLAQHLLIKLSSPCQRSPQLHLLFWHLHLDSLSKLSSPLTTIKMALTPPSHSTPPIAPRMPPSLHLPCAGHHHTPLLESLFRSAGILHSFLKNIFGSLKTKANKQTLL